VSEPFASLLVVLDVDSTLANEEGIDEIAKEAGPEIQERVAQITARAMEGELDFAQSLTERVRALEGLRLDALDVVSSRVTATFGAQELVDEVHRRGGRVCAVSGGFHELVDPLASRLGLDDWRANRLGHAYGSLSGKLEGPIVDAEAKKSWLLYWAKKWSVPPTHIVAVGDGANDLVMMSEAAVSVAFVAKPIVRERALVSIDERNLSRVIDVLPH
jgi:phosphoserine phosphatase